MNLKAPEEMTLTAVGAATMSSRVRQPDATRNALLLLLVTHVQSLNTVLAGDADEDDTQKEALAIAALAVRIVENC